MLSWARNGDTGPWDTPALSYSLLPAHTHTGYCREVQRFTSGKRGAMRAEQWDSLSLSLLQSAVRTAPARTGVRGGGQPKLHAGSELEASKVTDASQHRGGA